MNLLADLPKASKKCWDGLAPHPFFVHLDGMLNARGFRFSGADPDGRTLAWRADAWEDHVYEVSFMSALGTRGRRGEFGFMPLLSVWSTRQAELERELRLRECWQHRMLDPTAPDPSEVWLVNVDLYWLLTRWPPVVPGPEGHSRWCAARSDRAADVATDFIAYFDRQGRDFLDLVSTPAALAKVLMEIDDFPGRVPGKGNGAGSVYPECYAGVLLRDLGETDRAATCFETALQKARSDRASGRIDADDVSLIECVVGRYLRWLADSTHA